MTWIAMTALGNTWNLYTTIELKLPKSDNSVHMEYIYIKNNLCKLSM